MKWNSAFPKGAFSSRRYRITHPLVVFLFLAVCLTTHSAAQFIEQYAGSLSPVWAHSAAWGDYDNDGDLDILLTGTAEGDIPVSKIYQNTGSGFTEVFPGSLTGVFYSYVTWGDYDNDGDLDIFLTGWDGAYAGKYVSKIYQNNGTGFSEVFAGSLPGLYYGSAAWGDYDNDRDLDILLTGNSTTDYISRIYQNTGSGFTEVFAGSLTPLYASCASWGDYDNDGDLDILLTGGTGSSPITVSKIYQNTGTGFIEVFAGNLTGVSTGSVAWGDYDNDGDLDILMTGSVDGYSFISKIYQNTGTGFTEVFPGSLTGVGGLRGSVAWGDYDNDGDLDILLTGWAGPGRNSKIYQNTGIGFTEVYAGSLTPLADGSVAWGDYDNDGDLDILLIGGSVTGRVSKIYQNIGTSLNTVPDAPTGLNASVSGSDVNLSWYKSTDSQTPQDGLTYNLRIGTSSNGINTLSPMSNVSTGYRRIVSIGNTSHVTTRTIKDLPNGVYYWSVQAIDNAFAGSPFATEGTFSIGLPGNIYGTITSNGSGLAGVTVKLLDGDGFPVMDVDPITTDGQGHYSFPNVPPADYGVMIVEPLGYTADQNPKFTQLASGATNTLDFTLSAIVVSNAARGMGYWKHQFDVYVTGRGNAQESSVQLNDYITRVHSYYTPHFAVIADKTTLVDWQGVLTVHGNAPMLERARQQLSALLLNFTSFKIGQYTVVTEDNRTAGDVLTYVSTLIVDGENSNDGLAKDLAEWVNNQQLIGAGIVPSSQILYKGGSQQIVWDFRFPKEFELYQNYPNPFNPVTKIEYQLPVESKVILKVYNVLGQLVISLLDCVEEAGYKSADWTASNIASGVYFYSLEATSVSDPSKAFTQVKKMLFVK